MIDMSIDRKQLQFQIEKNEKEIRNISKKSHTFVFFACRFYL
jgi:hypothetical protein